MKKQKVKVDAIFQLLRCFILIFLVTNCKPTKTANIILNNENMTEQEYLQKGKFIWDNFVPQSGQADYVQGELIRAIEKLRDEAQRNGNANYNENCHAILVDYLRVKLIDKDVFDEQIIIKVINYLNILNQPERVYLQDNIYDYISDRIVDWNLHYGDDFKHKNNPNLNC